MNWYAVRAIYGFEMARFWRTALQSIVAPVIATSLYFVVFGAAIGSRVASVDGVAYGAFIVPGLMMLSLLTQSIANASFGIYFPRFAGTIYEILSAPVSPLEIVLGYVGAAASKSIFIGLIILATAALFVPLGNLLMQATGTWATVLYTVAIMDLVAAFLALAVLRPMLKRHHAAQGNVQPAGVLAHA